MFKLIVYGNGVTNPTITVGAFLLANPDSDSHNPIFVSPFHLSESEIRFETKESTPNSGFFGFNFNLDLDSLFLYPFHCMLFEFVFKRIFPWDRNEIGLN